MTKAAAQTYHAIGFRKAEPPEPKRYAQCRNCKHFVYDDSEYIGSNGKMYSKQLKLRCGMHKIAVLKSSVCVTHEFLYADRGDR